MKLERVAPVVLTIFAILYFSVSPAAVRAQTSPEQNQATALMRGYRTGYSDGYQEGVADAAKKGAREFRNKADYDHADRAFNPAWGSVEEYRDGYRQGYETAYNAAYDHKGFDSSIPADLKRRSEDTTVQSPNDQNKQPSQTNTQPVDQTTQPVNKSQTDVQSQQPDNGNGPLVLPRDTILRVELLNNLSTEVSQKGDAFQMRVVDSGPYQGATLEGHVVQVQRPGKAKGTAQLQLAFDKISLPTGHSAKLVAQVIEVVKTGISENVGKVDPEGGVNGTDSTRSDVKKVGIATGIGAAIGALFGGGAGAAIGAGIGAGTGTAGVLTQRGKDIYLNHGQHLRIRTNADAEIQ